MAELHVEICSHFFKVTQITPRGREAVVLFAKKMAQWGYNRVPTPGGRARFVYEPLRMFCAATADRTEYRFHIHQLKKFREQLEFCNLTEDLVTFQERPMYVAADEQIPIQSHWKDREDQVPVVEYLLAPEPHQKLVQLQTGKGKSYVTMRAMAELAKRVCIIVRPMYLDKWVEDILRTCDLKPEDLIVVQGSSQLVALIELARQNALEARIVLVSNKTMQNWLKLYEKLRDDSLNAGYGCVPDEFLQTIGAGVRVIDEVHQDFHLNFKLDLYTHVPNSISLSATLLADDDFINKMYEVAYPAIERYQGPAYHKYVAARAVMWKLRYPNKARTKSFGTKTYSHVEFEKSIIRYPDTLRNYLTLIYQVVRGGFLRKDYLKGDRCIVFCATIDLCTRLTEFLKQQMPGMDIRRYVEDDPFENLQGEIIISTLLSAGTAVDIDRLTTAILTTAITSSQGNVQGFGRLRVLKDGRTPEFYYFVCEDIPKHIDYHERKRVLLEDRALSYKSVSMPSLV